MNGAVNEAVNGGLRATLLACLGVALGLGGLTWRLTDGLQHWTFESQRRARAEAGRLVAPPTLMRDAAGQPHTWPASGTAPVAVVDFIYTRCPSVCQSLGSTFEQLQAQLAREPLAGVRLLSISFDIEHDDAAALAAHARRHRADAAQWQLLVPANAAERDRLLRALGVVVIGDGAGGYVHNASLHVIDAAGRVRAIHNDTEGAAALALARVVASEGLPP
jgi:protein SCO1